MNGGRELSRRESSAAYLVSRPPLRRRLADRPPQSSAVIATEMALVCGGLDGG